MHVQVFTVTALLFTHNCTCISKLYYYIVMYIVWCKLKIHGEGIMSPVYFPLLPSGREINISMKTQGNKQFPFQLEK